MITSLSDLGGLEPYRNWLVRGSEAHERYLLTALAKGLSLSGLVRQRGWSSCYAIPPSGTVSVAPDPWVDSNGDSGGKYSRLADVFSSLCGEGGLVVEDFMHKKADPASSRLPIEFINNEAYWPIEIGNDLEGVLRQTFSSPYAIYFLSSSQEEVRALRAGACDQEQLLRIFSRAVRVVAVDAFDMCGYVLAELTR